MTTDSRNDLTYEVVCLQNDSQDTCRSATDALVTFENVQPTALGLVEVKVAANTFANGVTSRFIFIVKRFDSEVARAQSTIYFGENRIRVEIVSLTQKATNLMDVTKQQNLVCQPDTKAGNINLVWRITTG